MNTISRYLLNLNIACGSLSKAERKLIEMKKKVEIEKINKHLKERKTKIIVKDIQGWDVYRKGYTFYLTYKSMPHIITYFDDMETYVIDNYETRERTLSAGIPEFRLPQVAYSLYLAVDATAEEWANKNL